MKRTAIGFSLAAFALAACSNGSSGGTTGTPYGNASTGGASTGGGSSGGSTSGGASTGGSYVITVSNYTFAPNPITVPAGATITLKNTDSFGHTATSEAAATNYTQGTAPNGFSFNVSLPGGGGGTIVVPSGLPSGTSQPYFCAIHTSMMMDPNPVIIIQ